MQTFIASHSQCTQLTWRAKTNNLYDYAISVLCNLFLCVFLFRFCTFIYINKKTDVNHSHVQVLETLFSTMTINVTSKYDANLLILPTSHQITSYCFNSRHVWLLYVKLEHLFTAQSTYNVSDGIEIRHSDYSIARPFCSIHNFYFRYILLLIKWPSWILYFNSKRKKNL